MNMGFAAASERIEELLARHRTGAEPPSMAEIDALYTDVCAMLLTLEAQRAEADRKLAPALAESEGSAGAGPTAAELARRRAELDDELAALRPLAASLATAAEWTRHPMAEEATDLLG